MGMYTAMKTKILEHVRNVCGLKNDEDVQFTDVISAVFESDSYLEKWHIKNILLGAGADFRKTVEQNLEDPALCKLLVEVLNIK